MTFKRKVLAALTRSDLLEAGRALELDVTTNMRLDDLLDVLAGSKKRGMIEKILPLLSRDTLKAVCGAVGLTSEGREKQVLVDRVLAAGGEAGGDDKTDKTPSPVALRAISHQLAPTLNEDRDGSLAGDHGSDEEAQVMAPFGPAEPPLLLAPPARVARQVAR
jgi:hypothetical protein